MDENAKASVLAQIYVLTQMRDNIRQVSLAKIFRSLQHRDELYNAVIEALEELEDELDDIKMQEEEAELEEEE